MSKIYTKKGDKGRSQIRENKEVSKASPLMDATGTVDELESHLGYIEFTLDDEETCEVLKKIQQHLHILLAEVITGDGDSPEIKQEHVDLIEDEIDKRTEELPELTSFIYTSGDPAACRLHIARTIARRAERRIIEASDETEITPEIKRYINRLSDLLFTLARYVNYKKGIEEGKISYND